MNTLFMILSIVFSIIKSFTKPMIMIGVYSDQAANINGETWHAVISLDRSRLFRVVNCTV